MDEVPQIKNVDNMGRNFFHIEVVEGSDVSQIIDMKCVELKYGRTLFWNDMLISMLWMRL